MNTATPISKNATLPFTKMQGLGNDYVYMEEFARPVPDPARLAIKVSDRHFGIGADGLVLIGASSKADFRMRIFNADGSEAEMCGNASRCVAQYLFDAGYLQHIEFTLETLAGIRCLKLFTENGRVSRVRVDMGEPVFEAVEIPVSVPEENFINREITVAGQKFVATAVSMGNPHLVVPVPDVAALDLAAIGPLFEHHPLFPRRINTEFAQILEPGRIKMRVWERGSGETMACGTGACATLAACNRMGLAERSAVIMLRGGELDIEWHTYGKIYMTGPAATVFKGEYFYGSN